MSTYLLTSILFLELALAVLYIYTDFLLYLACGWVHLFIIRLLYVVNYLISCLHIVHLLYIVRLNLFSCVVLSSTKVYRIALFTSLYFHFY